MNTRMSEAMLLLSNSYLSHRITLLEHIILIKMCLALYTQITPLYHTHFQHYLAYFITIWKAKFPNHD